MRRASRKIVTVVLTAALSGVAAWGAAVAPVRAPAEIPGAGEGGGPGTSGKPSDLPTPGGGGGGGDDTTGGGSSEGPALPADASILRAGAATRSTVPNPPADVHWERDFDRCATLSESTLTLLSGGDISITDHLASTGSPWPENPECLYMGGFGIGPMNPIIDVDSTAALAVRSFAAIDADGDAAVLTIVDGEGWFWDYASKCPQTIEDGCGSKWIAQRMAAELNASDPTLNIQPSGIVIAATHAHSSPDFIGGWGFVPDWYMDQVVAAIEDTIRDAVTTAQPAVIEIGEERAREFNHERRETYRSAEEQQVSWFRALPVDPEAWTYLADDEGAIEAIATIGAYAAHPTTKSTNGGVAHADWPSLFEQQVEGRFGGVGLHFMTGLGNMSTSGGTAMGTKLGNRVPAVATGRVLTDTDIVSAQAVWRQPATNVPLTALAIPGFFDHPIDPVPAEVRTGPEPDTAPCESAAPISAEVPASALLIGPDLAITAAPGEVFANLTNTLKEQSGARVTLPLGQANDALGYMPQSFEMSPVGQQGLGFVAGGYLIVNYEDSYSIDRCFGDMTLETTLSLLAQARGQL